MSYLSYPYEDGFKELCAAMPLFYLDVFEMREVLKAEGRLLDDASGSFELIIANNFILSADEATIEKWESALGIVNEEDLSLEQRKSVILGFICGTGHIGEPEIRLIIGQYTTNSVLVQFAAGKITVTIDGRIFIGTTSLVKTLAKRIPAHLKLELRYIFRNDPITLHFGGKVSGIANVALPEIQDYFNFEQTQRAGGKLASLQKQALPEIRDYFDFSQTQRAGGKVSAIQQHSLPAIIDTFSFSDTAHAGGKAGRIVNVPLLERADRIVFVRDIYAGGKVSEIGSMVLPIGENIIVYPHALVCEERAGGRLALIGKTPIPVAPEIYPYPYELQSKENAGGRTSAITWQSVPAAPVIVPYPHELQSAARMGGRLSFISSTAVPVAPEIIRYPYTLNSAARMGGKASAICVMPVPVAPDVYVYPYELRVIECAGGQLEIVSSIAIPAAPDIIPYPHDLTLVERIGGKLALVANRPLPSIPDKLMLTCKAQAGVSVESNVILPVPPAPEVYVFDHMESVERAGGRIELIYRRPLGMLSDNLRFMQTAGAGGTIETVSRLAVPAANEVYRRDEIEDIARTGGIAEVIAEIAIPESGQAPLIFTSQIGGDVGATATIAIPEITT